MVYIVVATFVVMMGFYHHQPFGQKGRPAHTHTQHVNLQKSRVEFLFFWLFYFLDYLCVGMDRICIAYFQLAVYPVKLLKNIFIFI